MASNGVRWNLPRRQLLAGGCGAGVLLPLMGGVARAAEKRPALPSPAGNASGAPDVLDAEADKLVEVKYIPNDSRSAQIVVKNMSDRPVTLKLPASFVGVPVLAQFGGGMGRGGGMGGNGMGMGGQGMGGQGMGGQTTGGGGNQGMGGMGGMGGMFSIPPEKTRVCRVQTVCLEHGMNEPSSRMPYRLQRVDAFSGDPRVAVLLESLGRGELTQKVAQAAAWHIASGRTWQQLAAEVNERIIGPDQPFFSHAELAAASRVVARVEELVGGASPYGRSPGDQG